MAGSSGGWIQLFVFLMFTFVLANAIAWFLEWRRGVRIAKKTQALSSHTANHLPKIPVTIITGFLGAGKTTLVNRVLTSTELGMRVVVIENEVGSVSIDHQLLKEGREGRPEDGVFILKNGCMCCSAKGTGNEVERVLDTLQKLVDTDKFDYVIVETSGLADPGPIIQSFLRMGRGRFYIDGVVTMVDAKHISSLLVQESTKKCVEAERQLGYADIILCNKIDLVGAANVEDVMKQISAINNVAQVITCENSDVDLEKILNLGAYEPDLRKDGGKPTSVASHTKHVSSKSYSYNGHMNFDKLNNWLSWLADHHGHDLYRFKGILSISGYETRCVIQGVMETFTITFKKMPQVPHGLCEMVFIGRNLDDMKLETRFKECFDNSYSVNNKAACC